MTATVPIADASDALDLAHPRERGMTDHRRLHTGRRGDRMTRRLILAAALMAALVLLSARCAAYGLVTAP